MGAHVTADASPKGSSKSGVTTIDPDQFGNKIG